MFGEKSRTLPLIDNCIINACFHVHMNITCKMSIWQRHHVLIIWNPEACTLTFHPQQNPCSVGVQLLVSLQSKGLGYITDYGLTTANSISWLRSNELGRSDLVCLIVCIPFPPATADRYCNRLRREVCHDWPWQDTVGGVERGTCTHLYRYSVGFRVGCMDSYMVCVCETRKEHGLDIKQI